MLLLLFLVTAYYCHGLPVNSPIAQSVENHISGGVSGKPNLDEDKLNKLLSDQEISSNVDFLSNRPGGKLEFPMFLRKSVEDYEKDAAVVLQQSFQDAEVTPGLFQGDIAGFSPEAYRLWRVGLRWDVFPERKWDNATVPYYISDKYSPTEKQIIQTAVHTLGLLTCVKFVPYEGNKTTDYLLIWPVTRPAGCWSFIGRLGGQQVLSLQQPDKTGPKCLGGPGKPMHEIMHALGIFHEQSRADRDAFVKFNEENAIQAFVHNFDKQSLENTTYQYEYDYNSIMHYGTHFFSSSRDKPTLVPIQKRAKIGQRDGISRLDCYKINVLYNCFDTPQNKAKYEAFCDILGI
ncbi:hatching enzyme 1.2-like [Artemia franciscana]|uniref:Metalloendopeptidase n=1 Tax=Artemia franciscana TaxID=6661 RepID=A0AA88H915_ARTSF|nr:hypothetical protein QYM36_018399 [Artemia franciscana]